MPIGIEIGEPKVGLLRKTTSRVARPGDFESFIGLQKPLVVLILLIMVALCNRADHYIFILFLSFFFLFFSSPNLSGRRLDVYHTLAHGVALVRIQNAGLKCAARGSLQIQDAKNRHLGIITQLCRAISSQLRHVSTIGKKPVKQQYLLYMS